jgi:8-oxo-dGTP pyrophosphatase MutT (NUDIX family)
MKILTEIHRSSGINVKGKTIYRTAVRGVILRGRNLLMIYSSNVGDYKFPGGGVIDDETHAQALSREIQEECGTSITHIGLEIGAVSEYDVAVESEFDTFKMTSRYYQCEVQDGFGIQKLDEYEQVLGFKPVWIDIDQAIRLNKELLHSDKMPKWLRREIFILEYIRQNLLLTPETPSAPG